MTIQTLMVSLDGGATWVQATEGVRLMYENVILDGDEKAGEVHINATHEGLITDIWTHRQTPAVSNAPFDHNIGTDTILIEDIVARLVSEEAGMRDIQGGSPSKFNYLDISTAHLTVQSRQLLTESAATNDLKLTIAGYEYGYFISVPEDGFLDENVPDDVRRVCQYALEHGCTVIRFDRDADYCEGLPTYE